MVGCLFHVFEPSSPWARIHIFFEWLKRSKIAQKDWTVLHCEPTEEQSHHSDRNLGINPWHFATSARKLQVQHHAVASATQQWKKRSHQNVSSSSQTWQWRITHFLFPAHLTSILVGEFPALHGHDYRSIATGFHQPLPFLAPRYSQRSHVPDRVCGSGGSEDTPKPKTLQFLGRWGIYVNCSDSPFRKYNIHPIFFIHHWAVTNVGCTILLSKDITMWHPTTLANLSNPHTFSQLLMVMNENNSFPRYDRPNFGHGV